MTMRDEYDFSKGERGKFYNPDAQFNLPVYLEAEVLNYFTAKAKAKGVELNTLVNDLLKKDIDLIEGVK
jgi:predicted HicB family RNase H-like nuclease